MTGRMAPVVRGQLAFARAELAGGTGVYRLSGDPRRSVVIRHRTEDVGVMSEILRLGHYGPPPPAQVILRAIMRNRSLRVLDLGANIGMFGVDALRRYPSAQLTSYEADAANFPVLARCAAENQEATWNLVQACAMAADGPVRFESGQYAHSHVGSAGAEVDGVDVLPLLRDFDFVKIDIEGSEWPIITDPRWPDCAAQVAVIVMEWHDRGAPPDGDPRTRATEAVQRAGLTAINDGPGDHGLIWGWRPQG
jgi:FkbM family methyltransferase